LNSNPKDNHPQPVQNSSPIYPPSRNLWIGILSKIPLSTNPGNLSPRISPEELSNLFARYGVIEEASIIEGKGYGFVNFMSIKSAHRAKASLEGYTLDGKQIHINYSKGVPTKILWVGNVRSTVNERDLEKLFAPYGRIDRIDRKVSSNCAKIYFESVHEATAAFDAMQGYLLAGWNFLINYGVVKKYFQVENFM
jgi:RNA recognition motif-containing protein